MPLFIVRNDITKMQTDAIVAAEGHDLSRHGWVSGLIAEAAGEEYQKACEDLGKNDTGDAKITKGYNLPAKYVIHTTGPRYTDGHMGEDILLKSCYSKSLELAKNHDCKSISFPIISTGGYGFPKEEALAIATDTIDEFLRDNEMDVYLVVFDKETTLLSKQLRNEINEYIDDNYVGKRTVDLRRLQSGPRRFHSAAPRNLEEEKSFDMMDMASVGSIRVKEKQYKPTSIENALKIKDESFQQMLFRLIEEKGMKNSEVYTRANISKSHFSKIKLNEEYKPKKETVFAFAIALKLNIDETKELLLKAGYALSHSFVFDTLMEYFITTGFYKINEINITLFDYDQPLLGEKAL